MIYFLSILCIIFAIIIGFLGYHCYRFAKMILRMQDSMEDSLVIIEERISSISKILEIPLFFDSIEIRRVHEDLHASKDALVKVIESFSKIEDEEGEE